MGLKLFELAGESDDHRFSPFCWRVRMALAHKNLDYTTQVWRFFEKEKIAHSGQGAVPVLETENDVLSDSWTIAEYLEAAYPDRAPLFNSRSRLDTKFIKHWSESTLGLCLLRLVIPTLIASLHPDDRQYWRTTREKRIGSPLEKITLPPKQALEGISKTLSPVRKLLKSEPYLGGENPLFSDYMVFGALQWARLTTPHEILPKTDPVHAWFNRLLDMFGGMGRTFNYPNSAA